MIEFFWKNKMVSSQLRYLQTLNNIAAENNSTVVFPVPMDLFTKLVEVIPDTSGDRGRVDNLFLISLLFRHGESRQQQIKQE